MAAAELRPIPFVVGAPRSGTTLLRLMLDAHPQLAIPAETQFYPDLLAVDTSRENWLELALAAMTQNHCWNDFGIDAGAFVRTAYAARPAGIGDVLRAFYRTYAERLGKVAGGDKWPGNVLRMQRIAAVLPEARFVHIIRDGRDVAVSLREMWWQPCDSYEACIALWAGRIRSAREQAREPIAYLEVRYEALVRDPPAVLGEVCAFVGLPYDDAMLQYHRVAAQRHAEVADWYFEGRFVPKEQIIGVHAATHEAPSASHIGRWRSIMTPADIAACRRAAGDVLGELGYL